MIFFSAKKNVGNESFFYEVPSFQFKAVTNQEFRTRRNGWPEYTTIEMVRGSEGEFWYLEDEGWESYAIFQSAKSNEDVYHLPRRREQEHVLFR